MRIHPKFNIVCCCLVSCAACVSGAASAQETKGPSPATLAVWDTGKSSTNPLSAQSVDEKSGWKSIATDTPPNAFQGDAAISNGRVLAVARTQGNGLDLYSLGLGKPVLRARVLLTPGTALERIALTENSRTALGLEVSSKSGTVRFRLKKGDLFVEAQSVSGTPSLRLECPSRFVVLPDFFADDILCDARKIQLDRVELPSENFLLHFTGNQDAIVMGVFENRAQDVRVTVAGKGDERLITGSDIDFGKQGSRIWVAVLEGAGMWHSRDVAKRDANTIMALDWKMPFISQWRVNFTRHDGLTDSWDMLLPDKEDKGFIKPSWLTDKGIIHAASKTKSGEVDNQAYRTGWIASDRVGPDRYRWTTVLGYVQYPCWSDSERNGFLQPLDHQRLKFDGPVLIYPITRLAETPIAQFTPVDIMRNTLGVDACQHLLDVEGQKQEHVGRATCHVWRLLNEAYGAGQQKSRRKDIEIYVSDALDFVTHIRNRIHAYVVFGKELRTYLAAERAKHPELKDKLDELEALAREIDERVEPRMQTILRQPVLKEIAAKLAAREEEPTSPALAAQLNRDFLASGLLDYTGADWQARLDNQYSTPLTTIGGEQDEMVGECRWVAKALRQKAGILLASDPRMAAVAAEIRDRTHKMLRAGAAYEGARH